MYPRNPSPASADASFRRKAHLGLLGTHNHTNLEFITVAPPRHKLPSHLMRLHQVDTCGIRSSRVTLCECAPHFRADPGVDCLCLISSMQRRHWYDRCFQVGILLAKRYPRAFPVSGRPAVFLGSSAPTLVGRLPVCCDRNYVRCVAVTQVRSPVERSPFYKFWRCPDHKDALLNTAADATR